MVKFCPSNVKSFSKINRFEWVDGSIQKPTENLRLGWYFENSSIEDPDPVEAVAFLCLNKLDNTIEFKRDYEIKEDCFWLRILE